MHLKHLHHHRRRSSTKWFSLNLVSTPNHLDSSVGCVKIVQRLLFVYLVSKLLLFVQICFQCLFHFDAHIMLYVRINNLIDALIIDILLSYYTECSVFVYVFWGISVVIEATAL